MTARLGTAKALRRLHDRLTSSNRDRAQEESTRQHLERPKNQLRLARLSDDTYLTFLGSAPWCDGQLYSCATCGGRCCGCRHWNRH